MTKVWQGFSYNNKDFVQTNIPKQQINPRVEYPAMYRDNKENSCDELNGIRGFGGEASNKIDIQIGALNGRSCFVEPIYPKEAIEKNISGRVNVEVRVDGYGIVRSAKAVAGNELLRQSAVEAAYKTKFFPNWLRGEPVNVKGIFVYDFILTK
ncbi:MAG: energy transducer TonB [Pyrinomonadaceae bacterium]